MQAIVSVLSRFQYFNWSLGLLGFVLSSCQPQPLPPQRVINIQQQWELEPGDLIGDQLVVGSLGDISISSKVAPSEPLFQANWNRAPSTDV